MALNVPKPVAIPAPGGTTKDPFSWAATRPDTINVTGLGLSKPTLSGEQAFAEIEKMAYSDPSQWAKIKLTLANMLAYNGGNSYTKATYAHAYSLHSVWSKSDAAAVQWALTQYHNVNYATNPTGPSQAGTPTGLTGTAQNRPSFISFATTHAATTKTNGYATSTIPATAPIVAISATSDLTAAAQSAFATTLGRSASPQEAATFAKAFQDAQNNFGQAKNDAKKQSVFNPPAQPIQFQQTGQSPTPTPATASTDTTGIMAPPTPTVAAANFAARTNPTQASAQAAADGLGQFLSMLKGS